ncbi:MAG: ABC transporter ATP-binding protein, partial [Ignavibacteriaceae bacterium]
ALLNNGEVISFATPKSIKESLDKQIIEIVCSPILLAYKVIKDKSNFETQMFGDRINVAVNNYEKDFTVIEKILVEAGVQLADHRVIPTSLENVFIHLISENKQ